MSFAVFPSITNGSEVWVNSDVLIVATLKVTSAALDAARCDGRLSANPTAINDAPASSRKCRGDVFGSGCGFIHRDRSLSGME